MCFTRELAAELSVSFAVKRWRAVDMVNEFTFAEDNAERPVTMFGPDFPFPFDDWITHPAGLGSIPEKRLGEEVAIVGAGMSGMVAAYELMKLGLRPVVYEASHMGGRLRSQQFEGAPTGVIAELGGMPITITGCGATSPTGCHLPRWWCPTVTPRSTTTGHHPLCRGRGRTALWHRRRQPHLRADPPALPRRSPRPRRRWFGEYCRRS